MLSRYHEEITQPVLGKFFTPKTLLAQTPGREQEQRAALGRLLHTAQPPRLHRMPTLLLPVTSMRERCL